MSLDENVVFNPTQQDSSAGQSSQIQDSGGILQPPVNSSLPIIDADQPQKVDTIDSSDTPQTAASQESTGEVPPANPPPISTGIFGGGLFKKIIIGIVVLIVLIFIIFLFLPKGQSNKKVHLVWWGLWEDQAVMQPLISDFQRDHPNITIEYIKQDPKQYQEKLLTRIKNGTGPDIFRFHNTWVPMLSDVLLPLSSDVISPSEFKKDFYPVMQKDLIQNGGIYGIPLGVDSLGLYVNTDILTAAGIQPPQRWEDFVKAASKLTVKDPDTKKIKTAGAAMGTYGNITHAPDILSLLFIQQGVDMKNLAGSVQDETVALKFYTSFAQSDNNVWDSTLDESILSFAQGNLAMYIGFSWDFFRIEALNKDLHFKIYPVPQLVGGNANVASYWVEGVSAKSSSQKEALLFMQFLSKKETAQKFYATIAKTRSFGEIYARRDLASSLKDNKIVYPFISNLENASSSVFASDTNDGQGGVNSLSNTYLGNAVNSIVNDNGSTQTAIDTLNQGISQVFQKYGIH